MALHDDAVLNISTGRLYRAPVATAFPTDLEDLDPAWLDLGHSSADEIMTWSSEGGESTSLATLQSKTLRTSRTPQIDKMGVVLHQFDVDTLKLFYGSNAVVETAGIATGLLGIPDDPVPTTGAFLAVFWDGETPFAFYAPRAEMIRNGDPNLASSTELASLPLEITPLNHAGATTKYYVLPIATTP